MFTGIITEVGSVAAVNGGELEIQCGDTRETAKLGDSIAVNGVDLTVRKVSPEGLIFDVMPETFRRSNLSMVKIGEKINLEPSVTIDTTLSGHIVRGVVETTCELISFVPEEEAVIATFSADPEYLTFIAMKGPVCLDGASLTVMNKTNNSFSVSLVQYTQKHTNFMQKKKGARINLETDMMARYIHQLMEPMIEELLDRRLRQREND